MNMKIGVVVVTYNRIEELKKSLACYEEQTKKPEYIIVVDNCSTDGTDAFLKIWQSEQGVCNRIVISLNKNMGGAGGFYHGMEMAQDMECADWVWVADDDAFPEKNALEMAEHFSNKHPDIMNEAAALCGMCEYEGRIASVQRIRLVKTLLGVQEIPAKKSDFSKEYFDIDLYSFVGTMIRREVIKKAGLPRKDFFIYQDDLEHAFRVGQYGRIICIPSVLIHHKDNYLYGDDVTWRDYYATRNVILMYQEHLDKKSTWLRGFRRILSAYSSFNQKKIKVIKEAVKDGRNGKTGIHPVYKPGWKA